MSVALYHVDAFTDRPFAGNPAAVCLCDRPLDEQQMLLVARELNLSETAFVTAVGDDGFELRWFTPRVEVDLCGHATLASAHVLWATRRLSLDDTARFHTRSGLLSARAADDDWIELDFPALEQHAATIDPCYLQALGVQPVYTGMLGAKHLIELADEQSVCAVRPDFAALARLEGRGIIVTARAEDTRLDFVSRYFAPWVGVDEDPVTGSNHCGLAPYWGERLGKRELRAAQRSARGGELRLRWDPQARRVTLIGQAVTVAGGVLHAV